MTTELPRGWAWATVNDLARYVNGLAFKPTDWEESGRPIIRIQNLTGKTAFNHTTRPVPQDVVVRERDILVSWSATLDVFVWRGPEAVLNQHIFKVIPASHVRDHVFLRWALKNAIEELWASEHSHGTTMKHVNRGPFLAHTVKLPPVPEQGRIADALESYFTRLDDAVATLERVQRNLKRYRASVLKAAVEGRLVPTEAELARAEGRSYEPASVLLERILVERRRRWEDAELAKMTAKRKSPKDDKWKAKYVEPVAPDTSELPELPEGWCWASVDQLTSRITSGSRDWTQYYGRGDAIFLMAQNVRPGQLDLSFKQFIDPPAADSSCERSQVSKNDLLVTIVGANTGNVCRVATGLERHYVCQSVALMRPVESGSSSFLDIFLNSPPGQQVYAEFMYGQGRPHLSFENLRETLVPLPPIAEQSRICESVERQISMVDDALKTVSREVARSTRLRQSILKWAFEGRLVDQDPTDEPASVLLDRIRAERAASKEKPRRKAPRHRARSA